jgi:hypothetical protein
VSACFPHGTTPLHMALNLRIDPTGSPTRLWTLLEPVEQSSSGLIVNAILTPVLASFLRFLTTLEMLLRWLLPLLGKAKCE